MATNHDVDYKALYEAVAEQIRLEKEFAYDNYSEALYNLGSETTAYNRGVYQGYKLITEHILGYYEKKFGLSG